MRFSVIVPVYQVEDYLEECIQSIIDQSYRDFELILVDDGSPDNCPFICDKYGKRDNRISVIHKNNGGLISARKEGAKIASGDYICCIDGDDYIRYDYLECFSKAIDRFNPDIVCSNIYISSEGNNKPRKTSIASGAYYREQLVKDIFPIMMENERAHYFPPSIWAKVFKKELYMPEQLFVDPSITIGEDRAVSIPCVYRSDCIVLLDECLYYYRVNRQSMTKKPKPFSWESLEAFASHLKKRIDLKEYDFQDQYNRLITHQFFLTARSQFSREDQYKTIRKDILDKRRMSIYSNAIKSCEFSGSIPAEVMSFCLKKSITLPFFFYQKIVCENR